MPIVLLLVIAAAAGVYMSGSIKISKASDYPDVAPEDQQGSWSAQFDDAFLSASQKNGVPFALLKAHAIRESGLNPNAIRQEPGNSNRPPSASYGLMQILWWQNSNRFAKYGYNDDQIGDGSLLYDPNVNTDIAAQLIRDNLNQFGNLRDAINAYNTGVAEVKREAPGNYVNMVINYYSGIVGKAVE